jgi:chemotaxis protein MotB
MHHRFLGFAFACSLLTGCVTSSSYDQKVQELDACLTDRLKVQDKAKAEFDEQFAALKKTQGDFDACQTAAAEARQHADQLKQRENDLRSRLEKELTSKDVEISQLRGQLSVSVLDKILFQSGRADILPAGQTVLDKVAKVLVETDDLIRVEGHTDNVPISAGLKDKYGSNWELSAARAASVVRFFQDGDHKIDPVRLEAVGFGEYRPVASNDSDADRQRNRRVEIVLTARKPAADATPTASK